MSRPSTPIPNPTTAEHTTSTKKTPWINRQLSKLNTKLHKLHPSGHGTKNNIEDPTGGGAAGNAATGREAGVSAFGDGGDLSHEGGVGAIGEVGERARARRRLVFWSFMERMSMEMSFSRISMKKKLRTVTRAMEFRRSGSMLRIRELVLSLDQLLELELIRSTSLVRTLWFHSMVVRDLVPADVASRVISQRIRR